MEWEEVTWNGSELHGMERSHMERKLHGMGRSHMEWE